MVQLKRERRRSSCVVAVDAGSTTSGVVMFDVDPDTSNWRMNTALGEAANESVFEHIKKWSTGRGKITVLIEDIKPYSIQLSQQTIDTAKYIGELRYCLKQAGIAYMEIPRSQVKEWIKLQYGYVVNKLLDKKVEYRSKMNDRLVAEGKLEKNNLVKNDGTLKAATFVWIDDRMVAAAMRVQWGIEKPKVGHKSEHGLKSHAMQALALATYYLKTY